MIILGIDPGTTRVGYGLLKIDQGNPVLFDSGLLDFGEYIEDDRPHNIYKKVVEILDNRKPDFVAVERVFFSKNKKTAMAVSEARGAIMAAAGGRGITLYSYTPSQVKTAVGTNNQAGKRGVGKMVKLLLNLKDTPKSDDVADAIAVALCCAHDAQRQNIIDNKN